MNFFPLPQGQGSFLPTFSVGLTNGFVEVFFLVPSIAGLTAPIDETDGSLGNQNDFEVLNIAEKASEPQKDKYVFAEEIKEEENLSLQQKELELIKKSLEKYQGKRKDAADELGISERTLYRKIKQYNL